MAIGFRVNQRPRNSGEGAEHFATGGSGGVLGARGSVGGIFDGHSGAPYIEEEIGKLGKDSSI